MIKLNNIDFEFQTIHKLPQFGYEVETDIKKTISGKEINRVKGRRFIGSWSYVTLTNEQVNQLVSLIELQQSQGQVYAEIDTPSGLFTGYVFISVDTLQTRYARDENGNWIWSNYAVSLRSTEYVN